MPASQDAVGDRRVYSPAPAIYTRAIMRAEIQSIVYEIEQAVGLLRRHL